MLPLPADSLDMVLAHTHCNIEISEFLTSSPWSYLMTLTMVNMDACTYQTKIPLFDFPIV